MASDPKYLLFMRRLAQMKALMHGFKPSLAPTEEEQNLATHLAGVAKLSTDGAPLDEVITSTWHACCGCLPPVHPLYLPPLHASPATMDCLKDCLAPLARIQTITSSCNIALQGVLGVGKSTILRAVAIVGMLIFDVLCGFVDYDASASCVPSGTYPTAAQVALMAVKEVRRACEEWSKGGALDDELDPTMAALQSAVLPTLVFGWKGIAVVGDELNNLYVSAPSVAHLRAVRDYLDAAKQPGVVCFISGSANGLREMIFAEGVWGERGYPSLNDSVYTVKTVLPLRSPEHVVEYCKARWGRDFAEEEVRQWVLPLTGGVGRRIERYVTEGKEALEDTLKSDVSAALSAGLESGCFRKLVALLLGAALPDGSITPSLNRSEVVDVCGAAGVAWLEDHSWLIRTTSMTSSELLLPYTLTHAKALIAGAAEEISMNGLRQAAIGRGAGNAGMEAKYTIIRRFISWLDSSRTSDSAAEAATFRKYLLRTKRGKTELLADPMFHSATPWPLVTRETGSKTDLEVGDLCGRYLQYAKEKGVDAFVITAEQAEEHSDFSGDGETEPKRAASDSAPLASTAKPIYKVSFAQVTCGKDGISIPWGKRTSRGSVCYFNALLESGVTAVIENLSKLFPEASFQLDRALLLTNKKVLAPPTGEPCSVTFGSDTVDLEVVEESLFWERFSAAEKASCVAFARAGVVV